MKRRILSGLLIAAMMTGTLAGCGAKDTGNGTAGWYMHLPEDDKRLADSFLNLHSEDEPAWEMIRTALASVADTAIIPMQDYIGLGNEARMNTPSTLGGNWEWRIEKEVLTGNLAKRIKSLCEICGRCD